MRIWSPPSAVLKTFRLQKRGTGGVDTASTGGVFDISNLDRLGVSEAELVHKASQYQRENDNPIMMINSIFVNWTPLQGRT